MIYDFLIEIINCLTIIVFSLYLIIFTLKIVKYYQESHYHFSFFHQFVFGFSKKHYYFHLLLVIIFLIDYWYVRLFCLVSFCLFSLFAKKTLEITSLKYTKRICRFLCSLSLLIIGLLITFYNLSLTVFRSLTIIIYSLPVIIFLNALLMSLVEMTISHHYHKKAFKKIEQYQPTIIGITGSCGKTSVKNYLYHLLSQDFVVIKSALSYNTLNGLSLTVNHQVKTNCHLILEMGASHKGDIKKIVKYFAPQYAIMTEILPQHLKTFKSMETLINEKMQIVYGLKKKGVVFANYDNDFIRKALEKIKETKNIKIISFGLQNHYDVFAEKIKLSPSGISFNVCYKENQITKEIFLKSKLLGRHNIMNILASVTLCLYLKVHPNVIADQVALLEPVNHRLSLKSDHELTILDDSYNSNIQGFINALEVLSLFEKTKVIITPGIVELGTMEQEINELAALEITKKADIAIIVETKISHYFLEVFQTVNFNNYYVVKSFKEGYDMIKNKPYVLLIENDLPDYYFL